MESIHKQIAGREEEVLAFAGITLPDGNKHIHCPYPDHDDKHPSWRWDRNSKKAFCTCIQKSHSVVDVVMETKGLGFKDAAHQVRDHLGISDNGGGPPKQQGLPFHHYQLGTPSEKYAYTDEDGNALLYACRFDNPPGSSKTKEFRQCKANGIDWGVEGVRRVLYHLPQLKQAGVVHVGEGEKVVHALENLGLAATTNLGGAGKWKKVDAEQLAGKDQVIIFEDNDEPGRRHAQDIARSLSGRVRSIKVISFPELPEKADVADFIASYGGDKDAALEALMVRVEAAEAYQAPVNEAPVDLESAVVEVGDLVEMDIPEKDCFLRPWLYDPSISLLTGFRGIGKTFFAIGIGNAVARGEKFSVWECETPAPVLYVDGEMSFKDIQERSRLLKMAEGVRENPFFYLSDDRLVSAGLPRTNLTNEDTRARLKALALKLGSRLMILDNLASLCPGLDENSKQDWDPLNQWLIDLRFNGISTLMLHHVNKEGGQRGTSAREDNIDISISLEKPAGYSPEDGAKFIAHFSKARVPIPELYLIRDRNFQLNLTLDGSYEFMDFESNTSAIKRMIADGATTTEVAKVFNVSAPYVSKLRKQVKNESG